MSRISHIFIDKNTGESLSGRDLLLELLNESEGTEKYDWIRVFVERLPEIKKIVGSKSFDILVYILTNLDFGTNSFSGSYESIAKATGVGVATVVRTFDKMRDADFIRPMAVKSTWMVNPYYGFAGRRAKDNFLEERYWMLPSRTHFSKSD